MNSIALKMLFGNRAKYLGIVIGLTFASLLITQQSAIFAGIMTRTFSFLLDVEAAHVAPLLCAGIIGFRSLRVAGVEQGERVGLFGFGSSASLTIAVLQAWKCEIYVSTRGESHRQLAASLGATWVGTEHDKPPVELDRAITFAPSGDVVISALASLHKAGVVAINAIHLDHMPAFDYDKLLWGERQIRSVANSTRADARDFLKLARETAFIPAWTCFLSKKPTPRLSLCETKPRTAPLSSSRGRVL